MSATKPKLREPLVRLWVGAMGAMALLVLATAWFTASDPALGAEAMALTEARELVPLLERRAVALADQLARDASATPFRLASDGVLLDPLAPVTGVALEDESGVSGVASPAQLSYGNARRARSRGDAGRAWSEAEEGLRALEAGELATQARLKLLGGRVLLELERPAEALPLLAEVWDAAPASALLDGASLRLSAGHLLARAQEESGAARAAAGTRELLLRQLLEGRLPLPPGRVAFEAGVLAESVGAEAAPLDLAAALARRELGARLARVVSTPAGAGGWRTTQDAVFLAADGSAGRVWTPHEADARLAAAWRELLPAHGGFAIGRSAAREDGAAAVSGLPVTPAPFGEDWRLLLVRPEAFAGPFRERQRFLWTAAAAVALALAAVGIFGTRALRRRAELERLRAEFVAGVSHELRTPAASIALLAGNLAEGRVPDEARRSEYYEALQRDAGRLERLVADVLDFARLGRGDLELRREPVAVGQLLGALADEHRARLRDAGIELEVDLSGSLPEVALDATAFERALANLLENARKYAHAGGLVILRAKVDDGALVVEVEDRGPGVPRAWQERVFEPYARVPGEGRVAAAGAGLGLALVRATMEAHGGAASVRPGKDAQGALFELRLPLASEPDATS